MKNEYGGAPPKIFLGAFTASVTRLDETQIAKNLNFSYHFKSISKPVHLNASIISFYSSLERSQVPQCFD